MHRVAQLCFIVIVPLLCGCTGIGTSRWAMDDPVYAEKYGQPYSSNDAQKVTRMMKQSLDARFISGRNGGYAGLGVLGAELGVLRFPTAYSEIRGGLKGQLNSGTGTAGLDVSARLQTPTRLAPFIGVGGYLGGGSDVSAVSDGRDNDHDGFIDEVGEKRSQGIFTLYPEAGLHFWMTPKSRLSLVAQVHLAPQSDVDDFGYVGVQWSILDGLHGLWNSEDGDGEWSRLRDDELP
ncbi:MAG: hypothetical protein R3C19_02490 [Planctomycetaceae bacterium]